LNGRIAEAVTEAVSQEAVPTIQDQDVLRASRPPIQVRQRPENEVPTPELASENVDGKAVDSSADSYRISLPLYPVTNQERGSQNATDTNPDTTTATDENCESVCDRSFNSHQYLPPSPEDISAGQVYQPRKSSESQQQPGTPELLSTPKLKGILKTPSPKLGPKSWEQDVVIKPVNTKLRDSSMYGDLHPKTLRAVIKGEFTTMGFGIGWTITGASSSGAPRRTTKDKQQEGKRAVGHTLKRRGVASSCKASTCLQSFKWLIRTAAGPTGEIARQESYFFIPPRG
jgi:hypothetical protein